MSSLLVFNRVYRLEMQSFMLVFSTPLVNCCPFTFSLTSPTPPPLAKVGIRYEQGIRDQPNDQATNGCTHRSAANVESILWRIETISFTFPDEWGGTAKL
jgi:hypothetical protein